MVGIHLVVGNALEHIHAEFFTGDKPARICYQVAALPMGARAEIDAIAIK
ncbi:MAG: hypothetical protein IIV76_01350 [Alistipes sp.]|nr:hypothetical protein [Alistipes sp.]